MSTLRRFLSSTAKNQFTVPNVYDHFTAADFASDDAFLRHHLSPSEQSHQFWAQWLQQYPHQQTEWQIAQHLLEAVRLGLSEYARTYLSAEAEARLLARIQATNALAEQQTRVVPLWRTGWMGQVAAACLVVGLGVGVWVFMTQVRRASVYQQQVAGLPHKALEQVNSIDSIRPIRLPDGSSAMLYPQSKLSYPANFGQKNRTVYLSGKATFDVVKNPVKPFYVYANELVTRVLGTQFTVEAFEQGKDVVVTVQHGQVNVYPNESLNTGNAEQRALKGVLIQPNQQVVFSREREQFTKRLVAEPVALAPNSPAIRFVFDEAPVVEAFERIKKVYGINIIYNTDDLNDCQLTASLTDESLFQKLDIITQSIGATYQVVDGEIIIVARGCRSE